LEVALIEGGKLLTSRLAKRKGEPIASQLVSELRALAWGPAHDGGEAGGNGPGQGVKEVRLSGSGIAAGDVPSGSGLSFALAKPETILLGFERVPPGERGFLLPAVGAALRGMRSMVSPIHLLPAEQRRWKGKPNPLLLLFLLGLNVLLASGWGGSVLLHQYILLQDLEGKIYAIRHDAQKIERMFRETEDLERVVTLVEGIERREQKKVEILKELAKILPSDVWLTNLIYQGRKVELYGVATSAGDLIALLDRSPLFKNVEFVAAITKDAAGKERFRIKAEMER
jgi:Tfp pilus assembly protein PilN